MRDVMINSGASALPYEPYTGQPTPDNPIPIVNASGVIQAIAVKQINSGFEQGGIGHTVNADYAANKVTSTTRIRLPELLETISGKEYTLTCGAGYKAIVQSFNEAGQLVDTAGSNAWNNPLKVTAAAFMGIALCKADGSSISPADSSSAGLTITPYASNQIDLSAYDLRSAGSIADELIVYPDKTGKIIKWTGEADLGELDYTYTASWGGHHAFTTEMQGIIMPVNSNNEYGNIMSAKFSVSTRNIMASTSAEGLMCLNTYGSVIFATDTVSSVEAFKAAMSGTKLFYALATPIEIALTADQVAEILALETYAPETIIETELDLQSVDYLGDVKGYIDSKNEYSYSDQIIGKWADGKDLHRMVIQTTTPSAAGTATTVSNLIDTLKHNVKKVDGTFSYDTTTAPINMFIDTSYNISAWTDQSGIKMRVGQARYANCACEIIVDFTYKDGAAPAAASVMALTDDSAQTTGDEIILPEPEVYIDDTVVYGGN